LVADYPDNHGYLEQIGHSQRYLGWLLSGTGRLSEAVTALQSAVAVFAKLSASHPENPIHRSLLADTYRSLGVTLQSAKKPVEAVKAFRQSLATYERLTADVPKGASNRGGLASSYFGIAFLYSSMGRLGDAETAYRKVMELDSKNAAAPNNLAWLLATCADEKMRNPSQAVELAKHAVELKPTEGLYWNTLGVAHYRAGDWKAAIESLKKSDELFKGNMLSFNAFFLGIAQWQLGDKKDARTWYDKAVQWMDKNQPKDEELIRFRAEAEKVLELKK
jgi:tetratricopeptide (TPR) repeat protein